MICKYLFLSILYIFIFSQTEAIQHNFFENVSQQQQQIIDSCLQDLEELGYCIVPQVISAKETEVLYTRIWHEFVEKAWPKCQLNDRSNWKEEFPMHNPWGIFAGRAGQIQVMWDIRQDPRIVNIFAQIWNTKDLIVSMDGLSLMCPIEIREGRIEPFPHVDQTVLRRGDDFHNNNPPINFISESSLKTQPYTIQGQFLFEDSFEGDGGFYCIPRSHLRFNEFAPELENILLMDVSREERFRIKNQFLDDFFDSRRDELGNSYCSKQIIAPKGSLILWDSRTVHWNQHASKDRPYRENSKVRTVGYVCYVPKSRLNDLGRSLRREAFERGIATGHNPAFPQLKETRALGQYERYVEDSSYIQPEIKLSPLGESLLGID